jgi:hypothetical protein
MILGGTADRSARPAGRRVESMKSRFLLAAMSALMVSTVTVAAHHSFAAEYDRDKTITVTGEVTKLLWTNPHARVQVESKDQSGKVESWDFELGPPTVLMRQGWNRNSLKPGQIVTVSGFLSKDEPHVANARTVTLADGRQVFAGSSADTQTPAGSNAPQQ